MNAEIEFSSWEDFTGVVERLDVGHPLKTLYAFRGQAEARWDLEPPLLRIFRGLNLSEKEALEVEQQCLMEFKSQAHLHISPNVLSTTPDTVSWWTIMQHHGAPTRLLDWCQSMYVAAYFAVTGYRDSPGAVWLAHVHTVERVMKERHGEPEFPKSEEENKARFLQAGAPHALLFGGRLHKTDRMVAQQGFCTVCRNILGNHGEILRDVFPKQTGRELFRKFIIPANLKNHFLRKLESMNITANALFPGLDGLGRSIGELLQVLEGAPSS